MCSFNQARTPWQVEVSGIGAEVRVTEPLFSSKPHPVNLQTYSSWAVMYSRCILEGSIPPGFRVGPGVYKSLARRPSCAFQCRTHRNSSASEVTGSQMAKLNALVIHIANPPTSLRGLFACIAGLHPCLLCSPIYPITLPTFPGSVYYSAT